MSDLTIDQNISVYIGTELDKIRQRAKEDLARWDISPADRLRLHQLEDSLNRVIKVLGANKPNRQAAELGIPIYMAIVKEPRDSTIAKFIGDGFTIEEAVADLEDATGTAILDAQGTLVMVALPLRGPEIPVYVSPTPGTEEQIEERRKEVAQRKRLIKEGEYKKIYGHKPKFRVEGS